MAAIALVFLAFRCGSGKSRGPRTAAGERGTESRSESEQTEPDEPDQDEPEPAVTETSRATDDVPDPAVPVPTPSATLPERVADLHDNVRRAAIRHDWVTVDDHDTPCPPESIRIVYAAPGNLKQYTKGAYFDPLGPEPGESTDEVNGLLLCEGSMFLYRGFEAYWRADEGRWDVFPFPVIE